MKAFCKGLAGREDVDFTTWSVFLCDERHVDFTSDDSTYGYFKRHFLDKTPSMPAAHFFQTDISIPGRLVRSDLIGRQVGAVWPLDR